jgi:hypothetical protein
LWGPDFKPKRQKNYRAVLVSLHRSKLLGFEAIQSLYRYFLQVKEYRYRFSQHFFFQIAPTFAGCLTAARPNCLIVGHLTSLLPTVPIAPLPHCMSHCPTTWLFLCHLIVSYLTFPVTCCPFASLSHRTAPLLTCPTAPLSQSFAASLPRCLSVSLPTPPLPHEQWLTAALCPTVLLSHCFTVLLHCCLTVLLPHCHHYLIVSLPHCLTVSLPL